MTTALQRRSTAKIRLHRALAFDQARANDGQPKNIVYRMDENNNRDNRAADTYKCVPKTFTFYLLNDSVGVVSVTLAGC